RHHRRVRHCRSPRCLSISGGALPCPHSRGRWRGARLDRPLVDGELLLDVTVEIAGFAVLCGRRTADRSEYPAAELSIRAAESDRPPGSRQVELLRVPRPY